MNGRTFRGSPRDVHMTDQSNIHTVSAAFTNRMLRIYELVVVEHRTSLAGFWSGIGWDQVGS